MNRPPPAEVTVPVIEEQLDVRVETVDTGRPLRLRKQVETHSAIVRESLAVVSVHVERVPIGRVVDAMPCLRQEGEVTVVPVVEERLVTRKELVLVEEVRLTRQHQVVQAEAEVPLRREQVHVERFDPASGQWHAEPAGPAPAGDPPTQTDPTPTPTQRSQ